MKGEDYEECYKLLVVSFFNVMVWVVHGSCMFKVEFTLIYDGLLGCG